MTGGAEGTSRDHGGNLFLRTGFESEDEHNGVCPREEHRKETGSLWVLVWGGGSFLACALLP